MQNDAEHVVFEAPGSGWVDDFSLNFASNDDLQYRLT